jgi:hypothetical protein
MLAFTPPPLRAGRLTRSTTYHRPDFQEEAAEAFGGRR